MPSTCKTAALADTKANGRLSTLHREWLRDWRRDKLRD